MAAELLSFFRPAKSVSGDWSSQEIAEFYRVEAALVQAGVSVFVDKGVSDEGDPWFVFCRAADGEVVVHFARINDNYLIVADSLGCPIRGPDFRKVLADFVAINPTLIPIQGPRNAKLMLHPASLLAAIVATALYYMSSTEAVASTLDLAAVDGMHPFSHAASSFDASGETSADPNRKWSDWQVVAVVSAMLALTATEYLGSANDVFSKLPSTILDTSNDHFVLPHSIIADASPVPDLDEKPWIPDIQDAHFLFDNFILAGSEQLINQLLSAGSNDFSSQKKSITPAVSVQESSGHWWTSLIHSADSDPQYSAWIDTSTSIASDGTTKSAEQLSFIYSPLPPVQSASTPANPNDLSHVNSVVGSSSPVALSETLNDQTALSVVNNELTVAGKFIPQINLRGSLSVQDVINHGASDVFGSPSKFSVVAGSNDGQVAPMAQAPSENSAVSSTASSAGSTSASGVTHTIIQPAAAYELFNANATKILDAFVQQNTFEVLTSNINVVLFDTKASDFSSPDVVARTWSMFDGSTISIVGILPHNIAALA
jgi:hypothetical protein